MKHTPEPFSMPGIRFRRSDGTYDVHDGWFYSRHDGRGPIGPYSTREKAEQAEIEHLDSLTVTRVSPEWVQESNQVGEHFFCGETVMSFHIREHYGHKQYAIAKWWYGNPIVLAIYEDNKLIYTKNP